MSSLPSEQRCKLQLEKEKRSNANPIGKVLWNAFPIKRTVDITKLASTCKRVTAWLDGRKHNGILPMVEEFMFGVLVAFAIRPMKEAGHVVSDDQLSCGNLRMAIKEELLLGWRHREVLRGLLALSATSLLPQQVFLKISCGVGGCYSGSLFPLHNPMPSLDPKLDFSELPFSSFTGF
ncbi:hypothetical protein OPV22_009568 [Ensete ventricosum]|uniref:Calponin-homology (CH) domain-containing protein n=1 Tax=Ensete ventricosum TaxID=4639 RepID=A0AAV8RIS0_ENSVE|nr:hypothetical protein OPV22_009568 [Ensete ventricosum]